MILEDEKTDPGGHEPPVPPPDGEIAGAPEWAKLMIYELRSVKHELAQLGGSIGLLDGIVRGQRGELEEVRGRLSRVEDAMPTLAPAAPQEGNGVQP